MNTKEYLTEENYQKTKKKISKVAIIILTLGILFGGSLIAIGLVKQNNISSKYSEENRANEEKRLETERTKLKNDLALEKQNLLDSKTVLENKIKPIEDEIKRLKRVPFNGFNDAYYEREDKIEELEESIAADKKNISVIDDALDEGFNHCNFDGAKNNSYTAKYCSIKMQINQKASEIDSLEYEYSDFNRDFDMHDCTPFYMFGGFVIVASAMIAFSIYMITKRREMIAFSAQQVMPIAQEGIEKMTPTIGKAAADISKQMAPAYGEIAKEISKGIKEGLKETNNSKTKDKKTNK